MGLSQVLPLQVKVDLSVISFNRFYLSTNPTKKWVNCNRFGFRVFLLQDELPYQDKWAQSALLFTLCWERIVGFMPFRTQWEKRITLLRIWTWIAGSISNDDNRYAPRILHHWRGSPHYIEHQGRSFTTGGNLVSYPGHGSQRIIILSYFKPHDCFIEKNWLRHQITQQGLTCSKAKPVN